VSSTPRVAREAKACKDNREKHHAAGRGRDNDDHGVALFLRGRGTGRLVGALSLAGLHGRHGGRECSGRSGRRGNVGFRRGDELLAELVGVTLALRGLRDAHRVLGERAIVSGDVLGGREIYHDRALAHVEHGDVHAGALQDDVLHVRLEGGGVVGRVDERGLREAQSADGRHVLDLLDNLGGDRQVGAVAHGPGLGERDRVGVEETAAAAVLVKALARGVVRARAVARVRVVGREDRGKDGVVPARGVAVALELAHGLDGLLHEAPGVGRRLAGGFVEELARFRVELEGEAVGIGVAEGRAVVEGRGGHCVGGRVRAQPAHFLDKGALR